MLLQKETNNLIEQRFEENTSVTTERVLIPGESQC